MPCSTCADACGATCHCNCTMPARLAAAATFAPAVASPRMMPRDADAPSSDPANDIVTMAPLHTRTAALAVCMCALLVLVAGAGAGTPATGGGGAKKTVMPWCVLVRAHAFHAMKASPTRSNTRHLWWRLVVPTDSYACSGGVRVVTGCVWSGAVVQPPASRRTSPTSPRTLTCSRQWPLRCVGPCSTRFGFSIPKHT